MLVVWFKFGCLGYLIVLCIVVFKGGGFMRFVVNGFLVYLLDAGCGLLVDCISLLVVAWGGVFVVRICLRPRVCVFVYFGW